MKQEPRLLVLVDGNSLLHRAFHAIPPLTTKKGELTNAVFGFASTLFKVLHEQKPEYVAVTFDRAAPTFRHQEYQAYKANRPEAPEGLFDQMARIRQLLQVLQIPTFEIDGFEADDLLGTLSAQAAGLGVDTLIVTGDSDALQLVNPQVRVLVPRRTFSDVSIFDPALVRERYCLTAAQLIDFKALKGDASDNIPGVPGIGEKTATQLLQQYQTLEGVYEHLAELRPRIKELLEKHREQAWQSRRLATIVTTAPVLLDLEACRTAAYDHAQAVELLRELEFNSLVNRLPGTTPTRRPDNPLESLTEGSAPNPVQMEIAMFGDSLPAPSFASLSPSHSVAPNECTYIVVDNEIMLTDLARRLDSAKVLAVDTETTHQEPMRAQLVGISLSWEPSQAYYIAIGHSLSAGQCVPLSLVRTILGPVLRNPLLPKYGHNLKYDYIVLANAGIGLDGIAFDTMLASYLLAPSSHSHGLKELAWEKLHIEMTPISEVMPKGSTMSDAPVSRVCPYACADADISLRLAAELEPELESSSLLSLLLQVEIPLVPVLARMEQAGVAIDELYLGNLSKDLHQSITLLETEIYQVAGRNFNINSTQQLSKILFEDLHLPSAQRTKTGYSTAAHVLDDLRGAHPLVDLILDYRQLEKLKSTYVDALPLLINSVTGRVHTSFNQAVTATGRLSSSSPNLQNIPIRTELGRKVRGAFVPGSADAVLLCADYSQIEMRILAHVCRDERLTRAFQTGDDIHSATASEVFGVPMASVTSEQRRKAKEVNFGLIYGMGDYGLANRIGVSQSEAGDYIKQYFRQYKGAACYRDDILRFARQNGYVTTALGRRRYLPEINASHRALRAAAERTAINMPIQGSAADIIKLAMVRMDRELQQRRMQSKMILQVHDELVFEAWQDELELLVPLVREVMENCFPLAVPLVVDIKAGKRWSELQPVRG
jgi:DNA polymerase-1